MKNSQKNSPANPSGFHALSDEGLSDAIREAFEEEIELSRAEIKDGNFVVCGGLSEIHQHLLDHRKLRKE